MPVDQPYIVHNGRMYERTGEDRTVIVELSQATGQAPEDLQDILQTAVSLQGTPNQVQVDVLTLPGTAILRTPQDLDVNADVTFNTVTATILP